MTNVTFSVGAMLGGGGIGDTAYHICHQLIKHNLLGKVICLGCAHNNIPLQYIQAIPYQDIKKFVVSLLYKSPFLKKNASTISYVFTDNMFDLLAKSKINKCDVLYAWNHHSLFSIKKAKKINAKILLETPTSHINFMENTLKLEYQKYNVKFNAETRLIRKKTLAELNAADTIITPSQFAKKTYLDNNIPNEKLVVIPYGVDCDYFNPLDENNKNNSHDQFKILYVGALGLLKGVQYLLEAFNDLNLKNAELILCGWKKEDILPTLDKYKGTYTDAGYLDKNSLKSMYHQSSVLVLPTLAEGSALVVYEAMACGLPVIVTPNAGSIAKNNEDGFIIPPGNAEALKDKILALYQDKSLQEYMGYNARKHALSYSWNNRGTQLASFIKKWCA